MMKKREESKKLMEKTAVLGLAGFAGAAALAAGTDAYAYTVRYDGPFVWCERPEPGGNCWQPEWSSYLDITKPASEQLGVTEGFQSMWYQRYWGSSTTVYTSDSDYQVAYMGWKEWEGGFAEGEIIGDGLTFKGSSQLNIATTGYFGLKIPGNHYGWVQTEKVPGRLLALAWGYETEAGVGIAAGAPMAPEPGSLAMLAAGAAVLVGSKRLRRKRE
ncbi:MAG: PEP-CTERM sorting domain-containing protein [Nitrospiraceae bacterium]|nr:MAG: PEP-CTERM sorting domain-containing protein [Nitrospiraceae bacterium]